MKISIDCGSECQEECLLDDMCILTCDDQCDDCPARFPCFATRFDEKHKYKALPESVIKSLVRSGRVVREEYGGTYQVKLVERVIRC